MINLEDFNDLGHAPGYQQKILPKIQSSKMFENNLKQFKSWTRGCICNIENNILQKNDFWHPLINMVTRNLFG